jgi:TonB family protein
VTRNVLLTAYTLVFSLASLFGQESRSPADPLTASINATSQGNVENLTYVSGFEVVNGTKEPKDLGFYFNQILFRVRGKWYPQIPGLQQAIGKKSGTTVVEFEVNLDGSLGKARTIESAGDMAMDATASQAIYSSAPFARLPETYPEKVLTMRMHFGYAQPASAEAQMCNGPNWGAPPAGNAVFHQIGHGVTAPKATFSPDPEYSEQARKAKYVSAAWIAGTVDVQGAFTDLCLARAAGSGLDEKAMSAVKTWKFEPAMLQGQPVPVRIVVEVEFHLY